MVIGVDAGAICETDDRLKVGVYRVTLELLKHLSRIDSVNTYRLYSFSPIPIGIIKNFGKNMVNISLAPSVGYMKVRLPLKLMLEPVDIFLGVAQAIPSGAKKAIGFIYDLGFLHHPEVYGAQAKVLTKQTAALVSRSAHIITISVASKNDIVRTYGIKPERITVCYPGVSGVFVDNKTKAVNGNPYFLTVGLLKPGKNIPIAIRAFADFLKKVNRPYDFVIIGGDMGLDPDIQKTIQQYHVQERVHLLGFLPDKEVAKWYRGAIGFIALSETEGFCLPAVEALVSGCSVLYTKNGALPEIVGKAGIGVLLNNPQAIANAMVRFTKETFETELQAKKYQWTKFAERVYDILQI
jgi:glycosyltransferase involved in cell wall biosynthesis